MTDDENGGSGGNDSPDPEGEPVLEGQTIERANTDSDSKDFDEEE